MHHRCKSWRMPIHARCGNSLWARIDNFGKTFLIARAHLTDAFLYPIKSKLYNSTASSCLIRAEYRVMASSGVLKSCAGHGHVTRLQIVDKIDRKVSVTATVAARHAYLVSAFLYVVKRFNVGAPDGRIHVTKYELRILKCALDLAASSYDMYVSFRLCAASHH